MVFEKIFRLFFSTVSFPFGEAGQQDGLYAKNLFYAFCLHIFIRACIIARLQRMRKRYRNSLPYNG